MSLSTRSASIQKEPLGAAALEGFAHRPDWLLDALRPEPVIAALTRHVPEFASGALQLSGCAIERLFLKDTSGRWRGTGELTVEGLPGASQQVVPIRVFLSAPGQAEPATAQQAEPQPFGAEGWRCYLPELRLLCELEPPEQALEILPQLTDPEASRALLERSISAGAQQYRDMQISDCRPQVLNYKPGSRCTLRYHLEYPAEQAGRGWPATVIAKTYRGRKGEQAYNGMVALWNSPLATSKSVHISEPLAYVHELKLLVQAPLVEEQTLEQLLRASLQAGTPEALDRLRFFVRAAAIGLAELHLSGAHVDELDSWEERINEIPELVERLEVVAPELTQAVTSLHERLQALDAAHPADPPVPAHGSFDSDQVLVAGDEISFIDFDSFCLAEPALDVGHFRAAIMDSGMKLIPQPTLQNPQALQDYLRQLDELGELFLTQYEALAPISRQRLTLYEALDYLRDTIHLWTKPKPTGAEPVARILEYHLLKLGFQGQMAIRNR
jgi:hypothetical protein